MWAKRRASGPHTIVTASFLSYTSPPNLSSLSLFLSTPTPSLLFSSSSTPSPLFLSPSHSGGWGGNIGRERGRGGLRGPMTMVGGSGATTTMTGGGGWARVRPVAGYGSADLVFVFHRNYFARGRYKLLHAHADALATCTNPIFIDLLTQVGPHANITFGHMVKWFM